MATKLHVNMGEVRFDTNNEPYVNVAKGQMGCVLYGPYEEYVENNNYEVTFDILTDEEFVADGRNLCEIDIVHSGLPSGKQKIGRAVVNSNAEIHNGLMRVTVPFSIERPGKLEFRLHSLGMHPFTVRYDRKVTIAGRSDENDKHSPLYRDNIAKFRKYSQLGAKITDGSEGVTFEWLGIKCQINHGEDLIIINEVFNFNNYNFVIAGDACVIDVGMNVGLASLYFARMPTVRAVHSFEPFSRPFARACENFALNPEVRSKIRPHQIGLAGATEVLEVPVDPEETIGTSIRGRRRGTVIDKITIRDASEALEPIIKAAAEEKQVIVVKLDCEGSEFAIINSLQKSGLLDDISIFMLECHKNWSPDQSNESIVQPLVASGFAVFDFSHMDNPYGSLIYAAKRG